MSGKLIVHKGGVSVRGGLCINSSLCVRVRFVCEGAFVHSVRGGSCK